MTGTNPFVQLFAAQAEMAMAGLRLQAEMGRAALSFAASGASAPALDAMLDAWTDAGRRVVDQHAAGNLRLAAMETGASDVLRGDIWPRAAAVREAA